MGANIIIERIQSESMAHQVFGEFGKFVISGFVTTYFSQ